METEGTKRKRVDKIPRTAPAEGGNGAKQPYTITERRARAHASVIKVLREAGHKIEQVTERGVVIDGRLMNLTCYERPIKPGALAIGFGGAGFGTCEYVERSDGFRLDAIVKGVESFLAHLRESAESEARRGSLGTEAGRVVDRIHARVGRNPENDNAVVEATKGGVLRLWISCRVTEEQAVQMLELANKLGIGRAE